MNWQCRLYGHHWRHPGDYTVSVTADAVSTFSFECALCGDEQRVSLDPTSRA